MNLKENKMPTLLCFKPTIFQSHKYLRSFLTAYPVPYFCLEDKYFQYLWKENLPHEIYDPSHLFSLKKNMW